MDNASAHISLDIAEFCLDKGIIPVMLPANTTQVLQPADQCFSTLKSKMKDLIRTAGLLRPGATVGKGRFSISLRHALPTVSPTVIQAAWRNTGLFPLDANAIPTDKFVADATCEMPPECPLDMEVTEEPADEDEPVKDAMVQCELVVTGVAAHDADPLCTSATVDCQTDPIIVCETCDKYIKNNPLVAAGRIPAELAEILVLPQHAPRSSRRRGAKGGIILTAQEEVGRMKKDIEDKKAQEVEKEQKKSARDAKREEAQQEKQRKEEEREEKKKELHEKTRRKG